MRFLRRVYCALFGHRYASMGYGRFCVTCDRETYGYGDY